MQSPLVEAWGDFLSKYYWSWFVTLTFREETKSFTGLRKFNAFIRMLQKATSGSVTFFRVDELGRINGRYHIHALVGGVDDLRRLTWMDIWNERNGFATIEPFDPTKGAAWYCAKYLMKANGDWELGGDLEAFRISQPLLPMKGLRVQIDTRSTDDSSQQSTKGEALATKQESDEKIVLRDVDKEHLQILASLVLANVSQIRSSLTLKRKRAESPDRRFNVPATA
jgi:hypothetical protein